MEKQLNVKLAFNADTSRAQAQIQALQQSLINVGISTAKLPITKEIQEAQIAANQLKVAMNSAFNVDTGKIDLLKFNQSIQKSGTNLVEIRNRLMQIGPAGQQAFLSLAQSIASAEIPARRTSKLLGDLGTTLKNTIKWQFSSSMMHGFMGAVQSAYGYAQNLNKSLNDIRIVTGLSADEMDRFALKANKAAKELSASTLDYTNASLIYYQQGLNDQQVKERTDVTIKMANATGTTAEKVSQQMTAVWNNFDDGSKSLEYYADVMTALGAATASSTDEISQGLQKFAAVASTVGLSYEYATSALATITATTRESADSVGTALKTLFARIQGLKLGETLEDGIDLNKYSAALKTIGVEVLTANGDLREMDDILNDMGERWGTLTDAQKAATAQTVAGVRQYTQLIALMDNWDFFQSNLGVANSATGTLQEQADIYAESWEAASKRVKAAAEAVYTDLLNDDFFIGVTNSIEKLLTLFDGFLDSIGGAKGLLFGLSSILLNTFSGQAAAGLENMVYNFKSFVGIAQKEAIHTQNYMNELAKQPFMAGQAQTTTEPQPITVSTKTSVMSGEQAILQTIAQQKEHMNEIQQQESQAILEQTRLYGEQAMYLTQKAEAAKASQEATRSELIDIALMNGADNARETFNKIDEDIEFSQNIEREVQEIIQALEKGENEADDFESKLKRLIELMDQAKNHGMGETTGKGISQFLNSARRARTDAEKQEAKQLGAKAVDSSKQNAGQNARNSFKSMGLEEKQADDYVKSQKRVFDATNKATDAVNKHGQAVEEGRNRIQGFSNATMSVSEGMVKAASCATSLSFALTQITNLGNIWSDETLTGGQKLLQTFTSLGMMIPMLMNIFTNFSSITNALATSQNFLNTAAAAYAATQKGGLATMQAETLAKQTGMSLDQAQVAISNAKAIAKMKELGLTKEQIVQEGAKQLAEKTGMTLEQASIVVAKLKAGASMTEAMAEAGLTSSLWAQVVAWIAAQTAMSPVLVITLLIVAAIALLVGGFLAVTAAIKAFKEASPEGQLKAAKEEAASLAESLGDAEQAAQDLKAAFDGYDSAVAKLADCTEGTFEWQQALHEVNGEVLDLLNKYPELASMTLKDANGNEILGADGKPQKAITKDAKGNLKIEDWAREQMIAESQQAITNVRGAKVMADRKVREAEIKVDTQDLATQLNKQSKTTATKTVYGENGEAYQVDVSSQVAKYIAENAAEFQGMSPEDQKVKLSEAFEGYDLDLEGWVNAIADLSGPINSLIASIDANTAATKVENQTMVSSALADNQDVQDSTYTSQIVEKTAWDEGDTSTSEDDKGRYDEAVAAARAKLEAEGFGTIGINKATGVNQQARDAFAKYAKAAGIADYDLLDTTGNDDNRKFVYNDGEKEVTVSLDKMLDVLANQEAQKQMDIDAAKTVEELSKFEITDKDQKALVEGMLNQGLGALTEEQQQAAKEAGSIESLLDSNTLEQMKGAFKALYGDEEGAKKLEKWLNSLNEQVKNWEPEEFNVEEWKKDYSDKMKIINDLETGDSISVEDYALLGEEYQQYFQVQADGTAILIGKAEELKAKAQEIEIESIKKDITGKQEVVGNTESGLISSSTGEGPKLSFNAVHEAAKSGDIQEEYSQGYIDAISKALDTNYTSVEQAAAAWDEYKNSLSSSQDTLASTATSIQDLDKMLADGLITQEQYNNAFKGTIYKEAQTEGFDVDELQNYADHLKEVGELSEEMALKIALAEKKQGKATDDLVKNYKDYATVLKKAKLDPAIKGTKEYSEAIGSLRKDLSLLTGVSEDVFTEDFINSDAVQQALTDVANGVEGATERLKALAVVHDIKVNTDVDDTKLNALQSELAIICAQDYAIGTRIDNSAALMGLYDLLYEAGLTTEQIQGYFNKLGWDPELDYVKMKASDAGKTGSYTNKTVWVPDGMGWKQITLTDSGQLTQYGDQEIWVPRIGSKTGGGGFRKIDPPGGGSSGGSKGGGGGGGGSKKHAEKKSSSDRTRYHTLENQLEDLSAEYDEISEAADRAFGQEKLDNIDAQIEKTDELIDKQEEYLDAISQNLPIDKNVMTAYYNDVIGGLAMQFDENGNISNYDEIEAAMHAKYNSMADRYTDDSEEWQVFEKKYEQLEKYIEQYEETYDLLRDEEATYQELLNQRADLELEKVQYKIELELEIPESEIAKLEYQIGRIENDAYESAEAVQLLTQQAEAVYDQIQVNKQGLNDIIKLSKDYNNGTLTEEQADLIKEYRDNLLDLNEQFDDIRATIEEKVMETFDSFNEKLQTSVDVFDHYNSVLESYKNIVDIVGEDRLGISDQFMNGLNQASIDNAIEQLKATDTAMKVIQNAQAQAETALAEAKARGDEASQRMWEETLSSLNEEAQSAQEEMLSAWENALDAIAETFEATVERVVKTFNDSIYALGGLEGLQDDFSRQQENADTMLDDYQKIYELSKLSRDINKTIDDTDIIGGKQKLKKLLGEINKLQEDGVEMSQYDLEYLQKTYDLRLAELELEEAQRAKNTVRLSRDNEGNWSYIYTQNTDAVDAAQQKYEDALYAMQDLSSNYIDEMSEQLISTSQEMAEALAAIRIQDYANINDYYAEVERVQSQYQEELAMQEEELQKAIDNNKVLYDTDWTNYHNATGYKISDTELFATTFRDTLLGALIGSEEDSANFTDIMKVAVSDLTNNLMAGAEIYYTNLENAMNAAGTSTGDFAEDTAANIDAVVEKSKEGAAAVDQMAIEMQTAMENIMDSVTNWQEAYGMAMENIIQSNLEVIESFNQMLAALSIDADSITVKYDIADAAGNQAQQFDTGGYTGEWGKGGKLAVLHEKELILKPEDTSNFLTAVQITRAMLETIDLNAKQASFGLGNLVPSTIRDDNNQTLEQQVHIVAEFPNVNDHNEIEQAFNNLINTASQYANRK